MRTNRSGNKHLGKPDPLTQESRGEIHSWTHRVGVQKVLDRYAAFVINKRQFD
jgi:hypothetical protein